MPLLLALLGTAHAETELTVEQAVAMAVERNPLAQATDLTATIAGISAARAELDRFSVRVDANGGATAGVTKPWDAPSYDTTSASWDAHATASAPLYAGGAVQASIDRARAAAASASVEVTLTERDLARAAYSAYWTIKGYELQIQATEEGLRAAKEAAQIIADKADAGLSAGVDVNRSRVDVLSQQETLLAQQVARRSAELELDRLLHLGDEALVLTSPPPDPLAGAVALPGELLAARPELRRQGLAVEQADADVRLARSAALPTVSVVGSAGFGAAASGGGPALDLPTLGVSVPPADFEPGDVVRPAADATLGLQLQWNPFDLLRTHQAVRQAKLAAQRVDAQNTFERDRLEAEIRTAATQLETLRGRYPIVHERLTLARDNQTIMQDLYAQGSATILDLFNAQSSFRAAAIQEANLTVDLATAELDLVWLLGADLGATP
ncbi:MAG: TolC family protein [Myxococcota bacterium]